MLFAAEYGLKAESTVTTKFKKIRLIKGNNGSHLNLGMIKEMHKPQTKYQVMYLLDTFWGVNLSWLHIAIKNINTHHVQLIYFFPNIFVKLNKNCIKQVLNK